VGVYEKIEGLVYGA